MNELDNQQTDQNSEKPIFEILKVYIKDMSFETPHILQLSQENQKPVINVDLNVTAHDLGKDVHEVMLNITVTNKIDDKIIFSMEVIQAGIFLLKNFSDKEIHEMLNTLCPSILFPDVREIISNMTVRGGFPPLYLRPVDFDTVYQQQTKE